MANSPLNQLEGMFDQYLVKKAPFQLPTNVREALVNFAPWLSLIGGILGVAGALTVFGLGSVFGPLALYGGPQFAGSYFSTYVFSSVLLGVTGVMQLMAFAPLKGRKEKGWRLLYWSELIWIVASLIDFNLFNALVGGLFGQVTGLFVIKPAGFQDRNSFGPLHLGVINNFTSLLISFLTIEVLFRF